MLGNTYPLMCSMVVTPSNSTPNPNPTQLNTMWNVIQKRDPEYHQNLTVSFTAGPCATFPLNFVEKCLSWQEGGVFVGYKVIWYIFLVKWESKWCKWCHLLTKSDSIKSRILVKLQQVARETDFLALHRQLSAHTRSTFAKWTRHAILHTLVLQVFCCSDFIYK